MTHKIHINASWPTTDNQRDHAKVIAGLEPHIATFEAEIKKATGEDVRIDISAKRANAPKDTAAMPEKGFGGGAPSGSADAPPTQAIGKAQHGHAGE